MKRHDGRNPWLTVALFGALGFLAASSAWAVDGVLEINQACVPVGCFSSDTPGFPVKTQQDTSYRLTGDLDASGDTAIELAEHATLDLGGFSIVGDFTKTGVVVGRGASVAGGTIRRFNTWVKGVDATATDVRIENVRFRDAGFGSVGVDARDNWHVVDCTLVLAWVGLRLGGDALVRGNVISENGADGISVSPGGDALIVDNVINDNASWGILVQQGAVVALGRNTLNGNRPTGGGQQISGPVIQIAPNVCGGNLACP